MTQIIASAVGLPTVEYPGEQVSDEFVTTVAEVSVANMPTADLPADDLPADDFLDDVVHTPVVLAAYTGMEQVISRYGTFDERTRAAIAIAVGAVLDCVDCQAEQSIAGRATGWAVSQIVAMRTGAHIAEEGKLTTLLAVARQAAGAAGSVPEQTRQEALRSGWTSGELAELFVHTIANVFTTCLNHYADAAPDSAA